MKPVYLEFCGINSFSEKAVVDFRRLLSGGIFGIFGKTGSGKSTLLDAIHLALYGKIERASGSMADCINFRLDKAYVEYRFEILQNGERVTYHVRRERRRKAGGVKAWLYRVEEGESLMSLAEGTDEVDEKLRAIIGLDFSEFKKCIALPQGEFDALVKSGTAERVSLVARLFDLEKYGEKLGASIRRSYDKAQEECTLLEARMEENDGGRVENIDQISEKLTQKTAALSATELRLKTVRTQYEQHKKLFEEKTEWEGIKAKLSTSEQQLPAYQRLTENIARAEGANAVKGCEERLLKTLSEQASTTERLAKTTARISLLETELSDSRERFTANAYDSRIEETALKLGRVEAAQSDVMACNRAEATLRQCQQSYKAIKDLYPKEDFDLLIQQTDEEIASMGGDQTFAEFVKNGMKGILMMETYGEIRRDLSALAQKYPQTQADVAVLQEKYTLAHSGEPHSFDLAQAKLAFDKIKKAGEQLKEKRRKIEDRRRNYEKNELEKERIIKEGTLYRAQFDELTKKLAGIKELGDKESLSNQLDSLKKEKKFFEDSLAKTEATLAAERAQKEGYETLLRSCAQREEEDRGALTAALSQYGFSNADEANGLLALLGDVAAAKTRAENFFAEYRAAQTRLSQFSPEKFENFSETDLQNAKTAADGLEAERSQLLGELAVLKEELSKLYALRERYEALQAQLKECKRKKELWEQLKSLTAKNKFMEFIAAEYLQEICDAASKRLLSLTGNRYFLQYDKEFKAGDNFNGGQLRAVKTLSGGETFLVSLSLALSLSDAISQKSLRPMEFFFLDEGFGTLDEGLVDTVMDVLGKLSQNFAIGVISHVEELKHRIDNKIVVSGATEQSGSTLRLVAY